MCVKVAGASGVGLGVINFVIRLRGGVKFC